jgi:hypothetical protein
MDHGEFELKMAHRRMAEHQRQAEQDKVVKELKKARREQNITSWSRIIAYALIRLGKRLTVKSTYRRQSLFCANKDK